jgi:hypothetical protein
MFSETRYALNGDLRVAYRASRAGPRDIVFVSNWFTCCEVLPELPLLQGWVEAMSLRGPNPTIEIAHHIRILLVGIPARRQPLVATGCCCTTGSTGRDVRVPCRPSTEAGGRTPDSA